MKEKFLKLLIEIYPNLDEYDKKAFSEIMQDDGLGKCKPIFNKWGFLFGWFYLLYRRAYVEAFGILIASLMVGYFYLPGMIIVNSFLGGFCYYFLYLNKFSMDIDRCPGEHLPDKECLKEKAKVSFIPVIIAFVVIVILIWPVVYAAITGASLKS